jgi:VanZ family protein
MNMLKRFFYRYPVSALLIVLIWVACLLPVPETPLNHVKLIDKWVHFLMYGVLTATLWAEHVFRRHQEKGMRLFVLVFAAPLLMGGLVELAQANLTFGMRNGDWMDFCANSIGVCLGNIVGLAIRRSW